MHSADAVEAALEGLDSDGRKGLASCKAMLTANDARMTITLQDRSRSQQPHTTSTKDTEADASRDFSLISNVWYRISKTHLTGHQIDVSDPPDRGSQAWITVLICHFTSFHTWGFLNAFGVLQPYYVGALHQTPSNVSWIGSLQAFFVFFISAFSGRLTDAGYFHQLFAVGSTLQLAAYLGVSFAKSYPTVLIAHGVMGIGGGLIFIPSMSLVATYFRKRRALALALVVIGNSSGGLFYAAVLQNTLPSVGYGWAMRICGGIMLLTHLPANFLLKPRKIEVKKGPIVEWKAFIEPAYGSFAAGMFFTMVGMWVPIFYVCLHH